MSWGRSLAAAGAFLAAAAAIVVVGSEHPHPAASTARPHQQPVTSAALSCPGSPSPTAPAMSVFAVGPDSAGSVSGGSVAGRSRLKVVGAGSGSPTVAATPTPGKPLRVRVSKDTAQTGLLVKASGTQARGVTGAQLSTYGTTTTTGIAATWCQSPRGQWWFSGVDTSVGTSTGLVLSNPSPAVAVVDLHILGPGGVVDAAGANGIAIAPRSRVVLDLARFAPGRAALTLHVAATRGTVTAALSTTRLDGITPTGADWLPASAAPTTSVVVDAGVGGVGRQSLVITNVDTRQQVVAVRILDRSGAYSSTALADLQVPPESVVVKDVTAILKKQPTAIQLSAAGPLTGSLVSEQVGGPRDYAVSAVSDVLTTSAVVPMVNATKLTLAFATSSPTPERVRIRGVMSLGVQTGARTVTVTGAATTTWTPPAGWGAAYLVITVPRGSDLHAVASYVGARGVAQLPVLSGRRTVFRPVVLP